jgi:hypothetical protein
MNNEDDELVVRFFMFQQDWDEAWRYFTEAKQQSHVFIRDGLIKIGIVTYARPFMGNCGIYTRAARYKAPAAMVPEDFRWLHELMLDHRGNFIGHANFNTMKPKMGEVEQTPIGEMIPIQWVGIRYDHWFKPDEEFPEQPLLIDQAIELCHMLSEGIPARALTAEDWCYVPR